MMTTSMAVSLIVYGAMSDASVCVPHVRYPSVEPSRWASFTIMLFLERVLDFLCALARWCLRTVATGHFRPFNMTWRSRTSSGVLFLLLFSVGFTNYFKNLFSNSLITICFSVIFLMYLPVSLVGYVTYGDSLRDSIIPSLQVHLYFSKTFDITVVKQRGGNFNEIF